MATIETTPVQSSPEPTVPAVTAAGSPAAAGAPVRAMALGLWVVVGSLLAYGVLQTVLKAAALFG